MAEPTDPFDALRSPVVPVAPRGAFAAELRRRIERAAGPRTVESRPPITQEAAMAGSLSPYLIVAGASAAIDWYADVFGAVEVMRFTGDDGRVGHAELTIGPARFMLADEYPEIPRLAPSSLGGTTVLLHLEVADVDGSYQRAVDAGAVSERPPGDQAHGNRNAAVVDPFGHLWMLSRPIDGATAPVEPGYLVLTTPDLDRARAFYGALFGWRIESGNVAGGGHVPNTAFPLGFMTDPEAGRPAGDVASVYFRVGDLDAATARVAELGGTVVSRDASPSGANAHCVDDQGVRFDLWEPAPGY